MNRQENLHTLFSNVNEWLKFAEAKNLTLVTIVSALIIGIFQIEFNPDSELIIAVRTGAVFSLFVSGLIALISLSPIVSKIRKQKNTKSVTNWIATIIDEEIVFENIHFFGYLRTLTTEQFIKQYQEKTNDPSDFTEFEKDLVDQILYNSRITWMKYRLSKFSIIITVTVTILGSLMLIVEKTVNIFQ